MSFIIRNTSGIVLDVNDLGIRLEISEDFDLSDEAAQDVASSDDLIGYIQADDIVVLDPLTELDTLSKEQCEEIIRSANDPPFRIRGGELSQLDDVSNSAPPEGHILTWNDSSQLWEAQQGYVLPLPKVFYAHNGPIVQTLTGSFINIRLFEVVRSDNIYSIVDDNVIISESGWYKVNYSASGNSTLSLSVSELVIELNNVAIPGSNSFSYHNNLQYGFNTGSGSLVVQIAAGDSIGLRMREIRGTIETVAFGSRLLIEQLEII